MSGPVTLVAAATVALAGCAAAHAGEFGTSNEAKEMLARVEGQVTEVGYVSPLPGSTLYALKSAYVTQPDDQICGVSAFR